MLFTGGGMVLTRSQGRDAPRLTCPIARSRSSVRPANTRVPISPLAAEGSVREPIHRHLGQIDRTRHSPRQRVRPSVARIFVVGCDQTANLEVPNSAPRSSNIVRFPVPDRRCRAASPMSPAQINVNRDGLQADSARWLSPDCLGMMTRGVRHRSGCRNRVHRLPSPARCRMLAAAGSRW